MDQVHDNLTVCVCHTNDEDEKVREVCLASLKKVRTAPAAAAARSWGEPAHQRRSQIAALLDPRVAEKINGYESIDVQSFDGFMADLCPVLVELYPTRISGYLDTAIGYFKVMSAGARSGGRGLMEPACAE
jgi:hypothetical protein